MQSNNQNLCLFLKGNEGFFFKENAIFSCTLANQNVPCAELLIIDMGLNVKDIAYIHFIISNFLKKYCA